MQGDSSYAIAENHIENTLYLGVRVQISMIMQSSGKSRNCSHTLLGYIVLCAFRLLYTLVCKQITKQLKVLPNKEEQSQAIMGATFNSTI